MNMLKIRKKFKKLWPGLRHIWPWDRQYVGLEEENLREMVDKVKKTKIVFPSGKTVIFGDLQNLGDFWDCDDFACGGEFLMKLLHKIQTEKVGGERMPIAFGQARGSEFRSLPGLHALNHALVDGKIYFVDFDDRGRIWEANPEYDNLFYASV